MSGDSVTGSLHCLLWEYERRLTSDPVLRDITLLRSRPPMPELSKSMDSGTKGFPKIFGLLVRPCSHSSEEFQLCIEYMLSLSVVRHSTWSLEESYSSVHLSVKMSEFTLACSTASYAENSSIHFGNPSLKMCWHFPCE